jgi:oligoendopeptidase F
MNYKGYNIACHELGHNVEQVFSGCKIDHTLLAGVPNTAFTEALAFVFQARDLELLGIPDTASQAVHLRNLDDYWGTCEIAAVSLVDMKVWHWMYDHPNATPSELKAAVIGIAQEVWNEYYAEAFGIRDADILAVYSHMISGAMYLPDYTIGALIAFQIEQYLKTHTLGVEMERICLQGAITPDLWMQRAVGASISAEPMLAAARAATAAMQ